MMNRSPAADAMSRSRRATLRTSQKTRNAVRSSRPALKYVHAAKSSGNAWKSTQCSAVATGLYLAPDAVRKRSWKDGFVL